MDVTAASALFRRIVHVLDPAGEVLSIGQRFCVDVMALVKLIQLIELDFDIRLDLNGFVDGIKRRMMDNYYLQFT